MRVLVCALLRALVLPAAASATVDGSDYNRPFDTADVSDCVYTKCVRDRRLLSAVRPCGPAASMRPARCGC